MESTDGTLRRRKSYAAVVSAVDIVLPRPDLELKSFATSTGSDAAISPLTTVPGFKMMAKIERKPKPEPVSVSQGFIPGGFEATPISPASNSKDQSSDSAGAVTGSAYSLSELMASQPPAYIDPLPKTPPFLKRLKPKSRWLPHVYSQVRPEESTDSDAYNWDSGWTSPYFLGTFFSVISILAVQVYIKFHGTYVAPYSAYIANGNFALYGSTISLIWLDVTLIRWYTSRSSRQRRREKAEYAKERLQIHHYAQQLKKRCNVELDMKERQLQAAIAHAKASHQKYMDLVAKIEQTRNDEADKAFEHARQSHEKYMKVVSDEEKRKNDDADRAFAWADLSHKKMMEAVDEKNEVGKNTEGDKRKSSW